MPIELPAPIYPASTYQIALDGAVYRLAWRWLERQRSWYVSLYAADETPLRLGVRVVLDRPLWGRLRGTQRPAGELLAVALPGSESEPGAADLGGRVRLLYYTAAELEALAAAVQAATDAAAELIIEEVP